MHTNELLDSTAVCALKSFNPSNKQPVNIQIIIPILQVRKLRHEVR